MLVAVAVAVFAWMAIAAASASADVGHGRLPRDHHGPGIGDRLAPGNLLVSASVYDEAAAAVDPG